jgi:ArsR family metal-binding transcriptional regulator
MLITTYDLRIEVSKHSADVFEYEAIAHLSEDIAAVLPYLNATLRNGEYFGGEPPAFSWKQDQRKIAFWRDRIAVENLESREQAAEVIEKLVALVNETWEKRSEIEPDTSTRENLQPLELYKLLPRTNCKICGESSCFNFALKVAAGQLELRKCEPLYTEDQYAEQREQLESLMKSKRTLL